MGEHWIYFSLFANIYVAVILISSLLLHVNVSIADTSALNSQKLSKTNLSDTYFPAIKDRHKKIV